AVNECPPEPAGIARDVAVLGERAQVLGDPRREGRASITVVVKMEFHLTESSASELCEALEEVGAVFLTGEEPAMARRPAVGVAEFTECGIALGPDIDALLADVVGRLTP